MPKDPNTPSCYAHPECDCICDGNHDCPFDNFIDGGFFDDEAMPEEDDINDFRAIEAAFADQEHRING